ncbi:MAG: deoxyguanosinetriphosphate triphosphohydrolase [Lachnospiraceae bacterium]|nr:deoxyguanosinetriphosphate triphosphohydrolase [Lachnospiraceae bacterium]
MNVRERIEIYENETLSPFACRSSESLGRDIPEKECDIRTVFQRDRDRILHCKAFRRLKRKTQVFLAPEGDHYRTRLTHTLEVAQIARTVARALKMNEDLTEAIALGHDLGHTPFGHKGERVLNKLCDEGFSHSKQSLRVVEKLERGGKGLNLTKEVRDGIVNHSMSGNPSTMEGKIVRFSDKIAYINHDVDDALRSGILTEESLPREFTDVLGYNVHDRLNFMVHNIIASSMNTSSISLDEDVEEAIMGLRAFLFENLYSGSVAQAEEGKAGYIVRMLYEYYMENIEALPEEYLNMVWIEGESWSRVVCDYISGMTDSYAIHTFNELFVPKTWQY